MDKNQIREVIARRAALELKDGDVVNLGIGLPTMIPDFLPEGVSVILQSENGLVGMGHTQARRGGSGLYQFRRRLYYCCTGSVCLQLPRLV